MKYDTWASLADLIVWAAESGPTGQRISFVDGPEYSVADMAAGAARACGLLQSLGVQPGDRVAMMLDNCPEFLQLYYGISMAGAVSVPLNMAWQGPNLDHALATVEPVVVIADHTVAGQISASLARTEVKSALLVTGGTPAPDSDFTRLAASATEGTARRTDASSLATILFTSGTTGRSKGIMVTNRMALSQAAHLTEALGTGPADVMHSCLPLFHGNAMFQGAVSTLGTGASLVLAKRFTASGWWPQIRDTGATITTMLGTILPILWNRPEGPEDRDHGLRIAMVAPIPAGNFHAIQERFGFAIASSYGMTDFGLPIRTPFGVPPRPGFSGTATDDWECRLVDDEENEVAPGEAGELVCRPNRPWITQLGYWRDPEATVAAWQNLWFHTGDRMRCEDGWYQFVDRKKDAIRRAGENISTFEVESSLETHPHVQAAAVYAIPSALGEDEVMAAIVVEEGVDLTAEMLLSHARTQLPGFAVPRYVRFVAELPKTATLKIRKEVLRGEGLVPGTWDAGERRKGEAPGPITQVR